MKSNQQEILNNIDMIDVMSDYLDLKKTSSGNYLALCPFHNDKNPSFSVNPDKGVWHCFGCGESGNLITFLEKIEHKSYLQVMHELSEISHIPFKTRELTEYEKHNQKIVDILEDVQAILPKFLIGPLGNKVALDLIEQRQIPEDVIDDIGLGFVNEKRLNAFFRSNDFSIDDKLMSKLLAINKDSGNLYWTIPDRITFPIRNLDGQLVGFSGQILKRVKNKPKYKHSVYTEYGPQFFYTEKNFRSDKPFVIVEGFYDQISLTMAGIPNVISSLGTTASNDKVDALLSHSNNFIICLDGDEPGIKASIRLTRMLKERNQFKDTKVKIVLIPECLDPDDFRRKYGLDKLKQAFSRQDSESEYRIRIDILNSKKQKVSKEDLIKELVSEVQYSDDDIQKQLLLKSISKKFKLSIESLKKYLDSVEPKDEDLIDLDTVISNVSEVASNSDVVEEELMKTKEQSILGYLVHHPNEILEITTPENVFYHKQFLKAFCLLKKLIQKKITKNEVNDVLSLEILEKVNQINISHDSFQELLDELIHSKDKYQRFQMLHEINHDNLNTILKKLQNRNVEE